ncbi:hypothetical protein BOX15_Mlig016907g1 [Macrostomum lignano]|uniref:Uncharacterized protein n=1 Tax=Macrostomum lignano TaxID=282301 RepID=A0A267GAG9_9PLAT|nr:hypothetical protein BOX15_Mlig016907g1 [Macrostomum lignano]
MDLSQLLTVIVLTMDFIFFCSFFIFCLTSPLKRSTTSGDRFVETARQRIRNRLRSRELQQHQQVVLAKIRVSGAGGGSQEPDNDTQSRISPDSAAAKEDAAASGDEVAKKSGRSRSGGGCGCGGSSSSSPKHSLESNVHIRVVREQPSAMENDSFYMGTDSLLP